jgi:hypothetical protein
MYVKLFSSIYQGTLRGRPYCLLVFTNLLAHADSHGIVDIHPNAIADEIGLDISEVKQTLLILEEPDSESRSPESEGRRIVRLDGHRAWGWQIVNYVKYRVIKNEDDRREQNRAAQERWRNKNKPASAEISSVSPDKPMQKKKQKEIEKQNTRIPAPPNGVAPEVWSDWLKIRKAKRLPWTETAWHEIQVQIADAGLSIPEAIRECCARGWGSFRADWHAKHPSTQLTVPGRQGVDPALEKARRDAEMAAPIPLAVLEKMAIIRQGTKA